MSTMVTKERNRMGTGESENFFDSVNMSTDERDLENVSNLQLDDCSTGTDARREQATACHSLQCRGLYGDCL